MSAALRTRSNLSRFADILTRMYASLQLPWSETLSAAEQAYKDAGLVKTKGTLFMMPPLVEDLTRAFNEPPRPKTRMSSGAVALCKHFERGDSSSEHGVSHPFWPLPQGSNERKNQLAEDVLTNILSDSQWRNLMLLHPGVAVYEIRNGLGYGMRWTLHLGKIDNRADTESADIDMSRRQNHADGTTELYDITVDKITFRGFLEPILGLDHELTS